MQKNAIKSQLNKQIEELKKTLSAFEQLENHAIEEAEQLQKQLDALYKTLAVYEHVLKNTSAASELGVHLKIIQAVEKKEEVKAEVKAPKEEVKPIQLELIAETKESVVEEKTIIAEPIAESKLQPSTKKVELGINDKYRVINELFNQQQTEFNVAMQQLNVVDTWAQAEVYLDSLGGIYQWKKENALVKTFYSLVQKRFS